jgi:hypothetical protein
MNQSVDNRTGQFLIIENAVPFAEFQIRGYDHALLFILPSRENISSIM